MKFMKGDDRDDEKWKKIWMEYFSMDKHAYYPHSIPIVPEEFRKSNGNAHIPKFISIGPRHRGRSELLPAEGIKWRRIRSFLSRVKYNKKILEKCMDEVLKLDIAVRTSYGDEINLDRYELANVMLFDGCFLLELLLSVSDSADSSSRSSAKEMINMEYFLSDLLLVENQLPLVVIETLFINLFHDLHVNQVQSRALSFFGISDDDPLHPDAYYLTNHFLDIAVAKIQSECRNQQNSREEETTERLYPQHLNRCATKLEAVGITIKCLSNKNTTVAPPTSFFQFFTQIIKFNKSSNGKRIILEIPQLDITRTTQVLVLWKSFIAWEIHRRDSRQRNLSYQGPFTSYAILFNDLICCTSDVQLLKNKGVIVDHSRNNNRDIMDFFHSIVAGVDRGRINPLYRNMFHELNAYSSSATNYATKYIILLPHSFCRILDWGYNLRNFFKRGYNFVATLVTILTVVQTFYAIISYHDPKKN